MTRKRETRRAQIRAATIDGKPGVTLHAIVPGVVDDYGSLWNPAAFDKSLASRLPTLVWAHDWSEPLGPAVDYRTSDTGPDIDFVFSDFDAVPMARRAHTQVSDGTIRDCSVGFWNAKRRDPSDEERQRYPGIREVIEEAELDEVSLVLRGAVPGAKVVAVRSSAVAVDTAVELARRVKAGEITAEEAKAALDLLAVDDGEGESDDASGGEGESNEADDLALDDVDGEVEAPPEVAEVEAAADAALALVADRSRL